MDAREQAALVHQALLIGVHRTPDIIGPVAADVSVEIHAPILGRIARVVEPEDRPRQREFRHPASVVDPAFGLPHGIPASVRIVVGQELVRLDAVRGDRETHAVDAVIEAIEPDAEDVGVAVAVPLDQLVEDAVGCGVPHAGTHVEGPVIVGESDLRLLLGHGKGHRPQLAELHLRCDGFPTGVVQPSVNLNGAELHPDGFCFRFAGQAFGPGLGLEVGRCPTQQQSHHQDMENVVGSTHGAAKLHRSSTGCSLSDRPLDGPVPGDSGGHSARAPGWSSQRRGSR